MTDKLTIAIASDLSGFTLKQAIVSHLLQKNDIQVLDLGIPSEQEPKPYFEQAPKVAEAIQKGQAQK
jgi:ribose 5-phosphate isomerase B